MAEKIPSFDDTEEIIDVPSFDDTEELLEDQQEPMSQAQAALQGVSQGATFGFGDEIAGGFEAAGRAVGLSGVGGPITDIGIADSPAWSKEELLNAYREGREAERGRNVKAQEEHPGTYLAGDLAGGFAVPIPGSNLLKTGKAIKNVGDTGKALSKVKDAAKVGAVAGGLEAAGRTEEDITSVDGMIAVGTGATLGGSLGGVLGKLGSKLSDKASAKLADKAAKLKQEANISVAKAAGAGREAMQEIMGNKTNNFATSETAKEVGTTMVEEGLFKIKQSGQDLKDTIVAKLKDVAENRLNPLAKKADDLISKTKPEVYISDISEFTGRIKEDVINISNKKRYAKSSDIALFDDMKRVSEKVIEDAVAAGHSPTVISRLIKIKQELQSNINWKNLEATPYNEYLVKLQSNISDMITSMVSKNSPELAGQMTQANKTYHNLNIANRLAGDKAVKEALKTGGLNFRDYLMGGIISGASGSKVVGALAIGGKKLTEKITGKSVGDVMESAEALHKFRKAKDLAKRAASGDAAIENPLTKTLKGVTASSAIVDEQKEAPYKTHQKAFNAAEKATPEELQSQSQSIRDEYGEEGEKLAELIDIMSQKDVKGRRAAMFHILQNPQYRRMMKLVK